jgi:hypothetical protein
MGMDIILAIIVTVIISPILGFSVSIPVISILEQPMPAVIYISIFLVLLVYSLIKWGACKNHAEKVNYLSGAQSIVITIEFFILVIIAFIELLINSPMRLQFFNYTSSTTVYNFILTNPPSGISVIVGVISIVIIYLYFFTVLQNTKYFSKRSEIQEKYGSIFWTLPFIIICCGIGSLAVLKIANSPINYFDISLFIFTFVNFFSTLPIAYLLKRSFYNSNLDSPPETLNRGKYDYQFINDFKELKSSPLEDFTADFILIMTFILVSLSLFFECNIFVLLSAQFSLLVALFWLSQLRLIPQNKVSLELNDKNADGTYQIIEEIFILSESSDDYFIILSKNNQISKIMKNSVRIVVEIE